MENYNLIEGEFLIYEGYVEIKNKNEKAKIILTNINIVFMPDNKNSFGNDNFYVEIYPLNEIIYNNKQPQILGKSKELKICFLNTDVNICFFSRSEKQRFNEALTDLLINKPMLDNAKKAILSIDDELGISEYIKKNNWIIRVIKKIGKFIITIFDIFK